MRFLSNSFAFVLSFIIFIPAATAESNKTTRLLSGHSDLAKLHGPLLGMRAETKSRSISSQTAFKQFAPHAVRGEKLQCIIGVTQITDALLEACKASGLELVGAHDLGTVRHVVVRCSDVAQLESLVSRKDVLGINVEQTNSKSIGSVQNQADLSINANNARSSFSVNGSGVRVGVLSDSVNDIIGGSLVANTLTGASPQVTGDLPASIRVLDPGPGGETDEGAGMMELIYDLAPNCDLSFASATSGYSAFASNITALTSDAGFECDVIVDDVFYLLEPVYQDGPIAQAAATAVTGGISFFSSAGNQADNAHERDYVDINPGSDDGAFPPSGSDLHNFGASYSLPSDTHIELSVPDGGSVSVTLRWDEPHGGVLAAGPGSEADIDLYLTSDTNLPLQDANSTPGSVGLFDNVYVSSNSIQGTLGSPSGEPAEILSYANSTGFTVPAHIVVDHYQGREPVRLIVTILTSGGTQIIDKHLVRDRTITGHSAGDGVLAVAAMFYGEIDTGGNLDGSPTQFDVEGFSSLGGNLPIYFPPSGTPRYGSPEIRTKPEITAPDGTNTTFFGSDSSYDADSYPNFFGTSASAPHAAAVAALMLDSQPNLTPAEVEAILRSTALDSEVPGYDFLSGDGLIDAFTAVQTTLPDPGSNVANWSLYE